MSTDGRERRRFRRIHAPVICRPAGLKVLSKHEEPRPRVGAGMPAVDVSRGGVRVYSDEELAIGARLTMELLLKDTPDEVVFQAEVVWIDPLPPGSAAKYDVGLKFVALDARAEALLAAVLRDDG